MMIIEFHYFRDNRDRKIESCQGLIQDLNMGGDMHVSSRLSITNVEKYWRQIGLLCCVMLSLDKYTLL